VDAALKSYAVSEDEVIEAVEEAKIQVAILDACRDNGFRSDKSGTKGLSRRNDQSRNRLIAYATEEGRVAEDGGGANSTYAASLAKHLVRTEWPLLKVFDEVASDVEKSTKTQQIPTRSGNLRTDVYLLASVKPAPEKQEQSMPSIPKVFTRPGGGGSFRKEGAYWVEYPAYAPGQHFQFEQIRTDKTHWLCCTNSQREMK